MADELDIASLRAEIDKQLRANQPAEAEANYQRLLAWTPNDAAAWFELGMLRWRMNQWAAAEDAIRRAIQIAPAVARFHSALGGIYLTQQRYQEAAQTCLDAVTRDPLDAAGWGIIGMSQWMLGDLAQADAAYRQSLQIRPDDAPTARNYARLLLQRFGPEASLAAFEQAVSGQVSAANAWLAAGDAFLIAESHPQALAAYQRALQLAPADKHVLARIAESLARRGPPEAAEPVVRQLLASNPQLVQARVLLATLRERQFRTAEAAEIWRSLLLREANPEYHSRLLSLTQYGDGVGPGELLQYHRAWDRAYGERLQTQPPPTADRNQPRRPLRLGFLSADFARHPVGYLVLPLLEHLDKSQCQIACYLVDRQEGIDEYTARFQRVADRWDHFRDSTDDVIADVIRQDEIDILFDLIGHHGKRLPVFARKPAALQISWFGYVGTTGLGAMDYLLADRFHIAPGEEHFYRERVLRLPNGYACYGPPGETPDIGPLPAAANGRITFGSFNNPLKLSPSTIELWSRVLHAVEGSQLLLKFRGYEQEPLRDRLRVEFAQQGIPLSRILLEGGSTAPNELMSAYHRVDLALDTLPYSGGLTTCEALWMGVPVIALPGKTFAGRHAVSHLSNAGLAEFVARDRSDYVRLASDWALRRDDLASLRSSMRDRLRRSPLCDAPRFATDFLALIKATWEATT